MPHTTHLPLPDFLASLKDKTGPVRYAQSQNGNLENEYAPLKEDVPESLDWADEALQRKPDAVNLWIGDSRSISALHKDHYENLYCVMRGRKRFQIVSPVEVQGVQEREVRAGRYVREGEGWGVEMEGVGGVSGWPCVDVGEWGEGGRGVRVLEVEVGEGDVLYLPALWYHRVSQVEGEGGVCVAVNYWYVLPEQWADGQGGVGRCDVGTEANCLGGRYDMDYTGPFYPAMQFVRDVGRFVEAEEERAEREAEEEFEREEREEKKERAGKEGE